METIKTKTIIIVEDDIDLLDTLGLLLEEEGYEIFKFKSAEATLKNLSNLYPDVMIVDLMLPGKNGDELVKFIKQHSTLKNVKAILISADDRVVKSAKESGADNYLKKPFAMDKLLRLL